MCDWFSVALLPENVENVFMVGHTDSRGTNAYNEVLSRQRVKEVAAYLESVFHRVDDFILWQAFFIESPQNSRFKRRVRA